MTLITLNKHKLILLFLSFFVFTINGCATLSKKQCANPNWYQIGLQDGIQGKLPSYVSYHQKACTGISTLNTRLWQQGRKMGLKNYCTKSNAYVVGRQGEVISPVCGFLGRVALLEIIQNYENGREQYEIHKMLQEMQHRKY